jgi:hypothetical protein
VRSRRSASASPEPTEPDRDPAFELDHLTAASGRGASGATREDGRATSRPRRPPGGLRGTFAERLWESVGILARTDADRVIVIISLPAFMQVKELIAANS